MCFQDARSARVMLSVSVARSMALERLGVTALSKI